MTSTMGSLDKAWAELDRQFPANVPDVQRYEMRRIFQRGALAFCAEMLRAKKDFDAMKSLIEEAIAWRVEIEQAHAAAMARDAKRGGRRH